MATLTCADGKWNKQVSCEPVDCGRPDKYHVHPANFSFTEGTTYGKKCTFQCMPPAQLLGEFSTVDPPRKSLGLIGQLCKCLLIQPQNKMKILKLLNDNEFFKMLILHL